MIISAGSVLYCVKTQRFLLLLRSGGKYNNTWGFVGGKIEQGETVIDGLTREITEEVGNNQWLPQVNKIIPLEQFTSDDENFTYHTYMMLVNSEFIPKLNHEHSGYAWVKFDGFPKPLHPGVFSTLREQMIKKKIETVIKNY